jgi:hypothetical protein
MKIYQEVLDSGLIGSVSDQVKEVGADGYSAWFVLTHLLERRDTFLPFLMLDPSAPPEHFDQVFLSLFVTASAGYLLHRHAEDLNADNVYRFTHPPSAARMYLLMDEVVAWCSHRKPALEGWVKNNFSGLMHLTAGALFGAGSPAEGWANQISFLNSGEGAKYTATMRAGIAEYRKSLKDDDEDTQTIDTPQELNLHLQVSGAAGDPESRKDLGAFVELLRAENVPFSTGPMAFDTTGAAG